METQKELLSACKRSSEFWEFYGAYAAQKFMLENAKMVDDVEEGLALYYEHEDKNGNVSEREFKEQTEWSLNDAKNGLNVMESVYHGNFKNVIDMFNKMDSAPRDALYGLLTRIDGRFRKFISEMETLYEKNHCTKANVHNDTIEDKGLNPYLVSAIDVQNRIKALDDTVKGGRALIIVVSQYMKKHNRDVDKIMADIGSDMDGFKKKYTEASKPKYI